MSDHLRIDLHIEIYDQADLLNDDRSKILSEICKDVIHSKLSEMGFGIEDFFISGSVY